MVVFGLYLGESAALDASAISLRVAAIRLPHFPTRTFLNFNRPAPPSPFPLYTEGSMPRRTIRLTEAIDARIESAAKLQGYSTPSAFLRAAIKKALNERPEGIGPSLEQMAGDIREVRRDMRRLERAQQALFAFVDSLAKVILTCVPEPR